MDFPRPQALFLDRDGTLIDWVHYLCDPAKVRLKPFVAERLKRIKETGCLLFLHTNQSGVSRGLYSLEAARAVNQRMFELMGVTEEFFERICIATEAPGDLGAESYRKPSPRFVLEMIADYRLEREACYFVGDNRTDVETGLKAGINAVYVRSELGEAESLPGEAYRFDSLCQFLDALAVDSEWK